MLAKLATQAQHLAGACSTAFWRKHVLLLMLQAATP